jgi:hypothetical protein
MSSLTDYAEQQILGAMFRGGSVTWPANWYVRLYTTAPLDDGTGGTEVSAPSYAPVEVANSATNFSDPGITGGVSNLITIEFPAIEEAWGEVKGVALADADTGGNLWLVGAISPAKNVTLGQSPLQFAVGDLAFTLDN